jgi:glycerol-3-phosphate acyltransferase PlsY
LLAAGIWNYASLASLVALALLPIFAGFTGQPPVYIILFFGLFLLAAVKHRENIVRLMRGTEARIRRSKPTHGV